MPLPSVENSVKVVANVLRQLVLLSSTLSGFLGCGPSVKPLSEADQARVYSDRVDLPLHPTLSLTELPPLEPAPSPEAFQAAINLAKSTGATGSVLTYTWADLEPAPGRFMLEGLHQDYLRNLGRVKFLGIQVIHTADKSVPADLRETAFDAPEMNQRFAALLTALQPLLASTAVVSIGNEVDIYFAAKLSEAAPYKSFLEQARREVKRHASELPVGTTLTADGLEKFAHLAAKMDVQIVNYYHIGEGFNAKPVDETTAALRGILERLDDRPILFQEVGYPTASGIGGSPENQARFVSQLFDVWDEHRTRIRFVNYFMMYDFPRSFGESLVGYYGVPGEQSTAFVDYFTSLGLFSVDKTPRPAWKVFAERAAAFSPTVRETPGAIPRR